MMLAHHFPGLQLSVDALDDMTPAQIRGLVEAGKKVLEQRARERWAQIKVLAQASSGARLR